MANLILNGSTSGSVTLSSPAVSGTTTLTLPTTSSTLLTDSSGVLNIGSGQVYKDASGNVGIGTTSPGALLHVSADAAKIRVGVTASSQYLDIYRDNATGYSIYNAAQATPYRAHVWQLGGTQAMSIDASGGLILAGSTAQKATGTTWSNPSDQRLKDNIRDYTKGTTELMQVRVREWEYNGKGGTTEGMKGLGVIADEVMTVLPNTVETYDAKLNTNDENNTAIKKFDATEITWLLVKTVQEQQTIINDLKARIETLEVK
jgi:hypothetical protein